MPRCYLTKNGNNNSSSNTSNTNNNDSTISASIHSRSNRWQSRRNSYKINKLDRSAAKNLVAAATTANDEVVLKCRLLKDVGGGGGGDNIQFASVTGQQTAAILNGTTTMPRSPIEGFTAPHHYPPQLPAPAPAPPPEPPHHLDDDNGGSQRSSPKERRRLHSKNDGDHHHHRDEEQRFQTNHRMLFASARNNNFSRAATPSPPEARPPLIPGAVGATDSEQVDCDNRDTEFRTTQTMGKIPNGGSFANTSMSIIVEAPRKQHSIKSLSLASNMALPQKVLTTITAGSARDNSHDCLGRGEIKREIIKFNPAASAPSSVIQRQSLPPPPAPAPAPPPPLSSSSSNQSPTRSLLTTGSNYDPSGHSILFKDRSVEETEAAHDLLSLSQSLPPLPAPCVVTILHQSPHTDHGLFAHTNHRATTTTTIVQNVSSLGRREQDNDTSNQCTTRSRPLGLTFDGVPNDNHLNHHHLLNHGHHKNSSVIAPLTPPTSEYSSDAEFASVNSAASFAAAASLPSPSSSPSSSSPPASSASLLSSVIVRRPLGSGARNNGVDHKNAGHKSEPDCCDDDESANNSNHHHHHHHEHHHNRVGMKAKPSEVYTYEDLIVRDGRVKKQRQPRRTHTGPKRRNSASEEESSSNCEDGRPTSSPQSPPSKSIRSGKALGRSSKESGSGGGGTGCLNKYRCHECGKQYATSSNLSRHKQTHRSLDSHSAKKCHVCGKAYVSMPALAMHVLTHKLTHSCGVCGKMFSRPWLLQGHLRSHTGEKPYGCAHCGKAFADRSNLRAHMQTHSGDKNFECSRCHKSFALKSYLNKHLESACVKDEGTVGPMDCTAAAAAKQATAMSSTATAAAAMDPHNNNNNNSGEEGEIRMRLTHDFDEIDEHEDDDEDEDIIVT